MEANRRELAYRMISFCKNTVVGWISALLKAPMGQEALKQDSLAYKQILLPACEGYLNKCAHSLCNKDDPYINEQFTPMFNLNVGNPYCWHDLLLMIVHMCVAALQGMDKKVFLVTTPAGVPDYEKSMHALEVYLDGLLPNAESLAPNLVGCTLGHTSPKPKPNEKIFHITSTPIFAKK